MPTSYRRSSASRSLSQAKIGSEWQAACGKGLALGQKNNVAADGKITRNKQLGCDAVA